jgi:hypothetical protein
VEKILVKLHICFLEYIEGKEELSSWTSLLDPLGNHSLVLKDHWKLQICSWWS